MAVPEATNGGVGLWWVGMVVVAGHQVTVKDSVSINQANLLLHRLHYHICLMRLCFGGVGVFVRLTLGISGAIVFLRQG